MTRMHDALQKAPLLFEGAMGTELPACGSRVGAPPERMTAGRGHTRIHTCTAEIHHAFRQCCR